MHYQFHNPNAKGFLIREFSNGTLHLFECWHLLPIGNAIPFSKAVYSPTQTIPVRHADGMMSSVSVEELLFDDREVNMIFASVKRRKPSYTWRQFCRDRQRFIDNHLN